MQRWSGQWVKAGRKNNNNNNNTNHNNNNNNNNNNSSNGQVPLDSDQYKAVTEYFLQTLGASNVHIHGVARVNAGGFANFRSGTQQRVMFHGCKTTGNEDAILKDGFQVNACISGGANYGTWFAFNSAYSDSGFAFNDSFGVRHLFVCLVSNASMRMENATMRVLVALKAIFI
ncbi:unnamed protein product [Polarella glacialis]|uniref:PARP catalytic domain-containing protein n=1 Tax=Polarella glacialis TaxID=89957 RepID=A0A813JTD6_POLGL|nr:unnamed protein product [Polarella glacialis]